MRTSVAEVRAASRAERGATFAVFLVLGICIGAWAAALPALKAQLGLSDRALSLALLGGALGAVLSTIAAGVVTPRLGTGRATAVAAIAVVAVLSVPALAGSLTLLVVFTFLVGLANGALDVAMNGHASDIEERWGAPIMSSFHGAFSLGGLAGASLGGVLTSLDWSAGAELRAATAAGGVILGCALPWLGPGAPSQGAGPGLAWPKRAMLGLGTIVLFGLLVEGAMSDWSAIYLSSVAGSAKGEAAAGFAAFSLAMAAGRLGGDAVVSALGSRAVVAGGSLLALAGLGLAVGLPSPLAATLGFAMVGIGLSNVVPVVFSAAAAQGSTPAAGIAAVATIGYSGFLSGPPIIGAVASVAGLRTGMAVLIVAAAIMVVLGWGVRARLRTG